MGRTERSEGRGCLRTGLGFSGLGGGGGVVPPRMQTWHPWWWPGWEWKASWALPEAARPRETRNTRRIQAALLGNPISVLSTEEDSI